MVTDAMVEAALRAYAYGLRPDAPANIVNRFFSVYKHVAVFTGGLDSVRHAAEHFI